MAPNDDWRAVQLTPPGSEASIILGKGLTSAEPGSAQGLYLIVTDIEATREELLGRRIEVSEVFHDAGGLLFHSHTGGTATHDLPGRRPLVGRHPEGASYGSYATFSDPDGNGWCTAGDHRAAPRPVTPPRHP
ncbi:glyoxalase [Streptomyces flaveolus]|uniref:glyoxalase n=1 Tax=Streptomyces flaveolus TaxID=67297 RepID=UPI0034311885